MDKAAILREKWKEECLEWHRNINPKILHELNKRKLARGKKKFSKPKDPNAPKKVPTNYFLFVILIHSPMILYLKADFFIASSVNLGSQTKLSDCE